MATGIAGLFRDGFADLANGFRRGLKWFRGPADGEPRLARMPNQAHHTQDTQNVFVDYLMPTKLDEDFETERVPLVAPRSWIRRVDEWRRTQNKIPSRADAIRQLVDAGLEGLLEEEIKNSKPVRARAPKRRAG